MEPYEIRTTPARLRLLTIAIGVSYAGVLGYLVWVAVATTVPVLRAVAEEPSKSAASAALLLVLYGLLWLFVRMCAPTIQVVGMYLLRDRGKQVVAYRLDESGWRHVVAGTDVVIPWTGMGAEITERDGEKYHLRLRSTGPFAAARDPFSRQVRRTLRKDGGLAIPMTTSDPTEDELATAIAVQSGGRVTLER